MCTVFGSFLITINNERVSLTRLAMRVDLRRMNSPDSGHQDTNNSARQDSSAPRREAWDSPQLIPLDLGSAQAKFCSFTNEGTPDNGPKVTGCST